MHGGPGRKRQNGDNEDRGVERRNQFRDLRDLVLDRLGVGFLRNILKRATSSRAAIYESIPEELDLQVDHDHRRIILCGMHLPKGAIGSSSYVSPTMTQAAACSTHGGGTRDFAHPYRPGGTVKLFLAGDLMTGRGIDQVGHARVSCTSQ